MFWPKTSMIMLTVSLPVGSFGLLTVSGMLLGEFLRKKTNVIRQAARGGTAQATPPPSLPKTGERNDGPV